MRRSCAARIVVLALALVWAAIPVVYPPVLAIYSFVPWAAGLLFASLLSVVVWRRPRN